MFKLEKNWVIILLLIISVALCGCAGVGGPSSGGGAGPGGPADTGKSGSPTSTLSEASASILFDQRPDRSKPDKSMSGKLCWNPFSKSWYRNIVFYNSMTKKLATSDYPKQLNQMIEYVQKQTPPARAGAYDWEPYNFFLWEAGTPFSTPEW